MAIPITVLVLQLEDELLGENEAVSAGREDHRHYRLSIYAGSSFSRAHSKVQKGRVFGLILGGDHASKQRGKHPKRQK
jgi:hypothetical protein